MGKHTGPVSGKIYSTCTQQLLALCYLRLTWSWAPVDLLFVAAKCLDVTLVSEYRVEGRNSFLAMKKLLLNSLTQFSLKSTSFFFSME